MGERSALGYLFSTSTTGTQMSADFFRLGQTAPKLVATAFLGVAKCCKLKTSPYADLVWFMLRHSSKFRSQKGFPRFGIGILCTFCVVFHNAPPVWLLVYKVSLNLYGNVELPKRIGVVVKFLRVTPETREVTALWSWQTFFFMQPPKHLVVQRIQEDFISEAL